MSINTSDGLFTFRTASSSGTYSIHNRIPAQTMTLKSVRVQFDTTANALAAQVLYLDVPWLNSNHLVDGLSNLYLLPISVDYLVCTLYTCDIPVQMSIDMPETFSYRIVTSAGAAAAGFAGMTLQFSYSSSIL